MVLLCKDTHAFFLLRYHDVEVVNELRRHALQREALRLCGDAFVRVRGGLHGFIQDYAVLGEPSPSSALLIAATRRSFFLTAQRGISGNAAPVKAANLPPETDEFQEIAYLPRIIRKAEAKLFGTLDATVMYPDAKDRQFLREHGDIHPNDFLQLVWSTRSDRQKIITAVLNAIQQQEGQDNIPTPAQPQETPASSPASAPTEQTPKQTELNLG